MFGHVTRCCSTSSERPEFSQKLSRVKARYSPDMAPADFFLFPKLKSPLRSTRFQSIEDIKENSRQNWSRFEKMRLKNVLIIALFPWKFFAGTSEYLTKLEHIKYSIISFLMNFVYTYTYIWYYFLLLLYSCCL